MTYIFNESCSSWKGKKKADYIREYNYSIYTSYGEYKYSILRLHDIYSVWVTTDTLSRTYSM